MKLQTNLNFNWTQYYMLNVCVDYATSTENQPVSELIPDFDDGIQAVKTKITSIGLLLAPQKENTTGSAAQKLILKRNLANYMFNVSDPVAGYASQTGNTELHNIIYKAMSSYMRMRPDNLISQATLIIEVVTPLLPNLTGTSVNQNSLDAIADARDLFEPYVSKPRSKVVAKHQDLVIMVNLLKTAMGITRTQLDKYAAGFAAINQQSFLTGWERSRKLTPYGTLHTRASVDVVLGDTPVPNAIVSVDYTVLKGDTDDNGHATISRVPMGNQTLTITAPGYPNPVHTQAYKFRKGKSTHITINMADFIIPAPVNTTTSVPS